MLASCFPFIVDLCIQSWEEWDHGIMMIQQLVVSTASFAGCIQSLSPLLAPPPIPPAISTSVSGVLRFFPVKRLESLGCLQFWALQPSTTGNLGQFVWYAANPGLHIPGNMKAIELSIYLSTYLSILLSIYLSIYRSIYLSINQSIYQYTYTFMIYIHMMVDWDIVMNTGNKIITKPWICWENHELPKGSTPKPGWTGGCPPFHPQIKIVGYNASFS